MLPTIIDERLRRFIDTVCWLFYWKDLETYKETPGSFLNWGSELQDIHVTTHKVEEVNLGEKNNHVWGTPACLRVLRAGGGKASEQFPSSPSICHSAKGLGKPIHIPCSPVVPIDVLYWLCFPSGYILKKFLLNYLFFSTPLLFFSPLPFYPLPWFSCSQLTQEILYFSSSGYFKERLRSGCLM